MTVVPVGATLPRVRTIQVRNDTKRRLDLLGRKGDTYDAVIRRLIDHYAGTGRGISSLSDIHKKDVLGEKGNPD
jgi:hypothetical protein